MTIKTTLTVFLLFEKNNFVCPSNVLNSQLEIKSRFLLPWICIILIECNWFDCEATGRNTEIIDQPLASIDLKRKRGPQFTAKGTRPPLPPKWYCPWTHGKSGLKQDRFHLNKRQVRHVSVLCLLRRWQPLYVLHIFYMSIMYSKMIIDIYVMNMLYRVHQNLSFQDRK